MTTAARPTFDPAKGGSCLQDKAIGKISHLVSARDQPGHLKLKERLPGQSTQDELKDKDLKAELEEREKIAQIERSKSNLYKLVPSLEQAAQARLAIKAEHDIDRKANREAVLNDESLAETEPTQRFPNIINARKMAQLDKDEDFGSDVDLSESDFDDDDDEEDNYNEDEDEDDPEELMAELNRIKQERLIEEEKKMKEQKEKEDRIRVNSDDDSASTFSIKRRWDDDVPFKNCARNEPDSKRKLYYNDTLRQEFHRKFMDKYIR